MGNGFFDGVNAGFEALGGLFIGATVWRTYKDGEVKGVSRLYQLFFVAWGWWNLAFYPGVGAWASFWGGIGTTALNTAWVLQSEYYRRWPRGSKV